MSDESCLVYDVDSSRAAVYGDLYNSALVIMQAVQDRIDQRAGKGFMNEEECAQWASSCHLDLLTYVQSRQCYFNVTHRGVIVNKKAWMSAYCSDVLFVMYKDYNGREHKVPWYPEGHKYYDNARIMSEVSDGNYKPLYHRDYFTPTGFYDEALGTFNVAKPFPVFARETGRDTSHIYEYINHIAGECAPWLLAWLRAKMINPKLKTQVVPIIVSRAQGTGKSTFAEVICKGLFGKDNVLVTDQYDSQSRFNADYADALIVCHEEKEETDRKNPAATIKSRATSTQIRKERKGSDPIYQDSYTEFIITTNQDVPIKFDDGGDQRRFMVMQADESFTRKTSSLADEVFTKLYGFDSNMVNVGTPFNEDDELIAQFKHELYSNEELAAVKLREFPKTSAYHRCFTMPRTTENVEVDTIIRSVAPFIKKMLEEKSNVTVIELDNGEVIRLDDIIRVPVAIQYFQPLNCVILCRPEVFYDVSNDKPYQHAVVERALITSDQWLNATYGVRLLPDMSPVQGGFYGIPGRNRNAPAARFCLSDDYKALVFSKTATKFNVVASLSERPEKQRIGKRLRVNGSWRVDPDGEFETVNELKDGVETLENKTQNVAYLDTFLFEADEVSKDIYGIELQRIEQWKSVHNSMETMQATTLFAERLKVQLSEAERLFRQGIACRVVYSGSKSYHILVRVANPPANIDEYKWLHAHLCQILSDKLTFDASTSDPARLTRAPVVKERMTQYMGVNIKGVQAPIHTNWNAVFNYEWRYLYKQWLDRPLAPYEQAYGKRLLPTKPEYRDAMFALLSGTFFSDPKWNGRRQQCFFPAYRLCRYLGYTHEQLWSDEGILEGIENYYRKGEIMYWKTRESCDLIRSIDESIDDAEGDDDGQARL